jgi:transglutaminase-like putative cysteine protease
MFGQGRACKVGQEIFLRFPKGCARTCLAVFLISTAVTTQASAQNDKPSIAPPSKWVVPVRSDGKFNPDPADPSIDLRWVLVDRQINAKNDEQFFHWVRQVLTPDGVQKSSQIAIEYDPGYESLTMHWVRIWRGTNALNRLDLSNFQPPRRELDTVDDLLSVEKRVILLLDDVRPGDIIDYAYSLDGSNPALNGTFADRVPVQFRDPVDHFVTRLLWAPPRKFYVQNHGTDIYPATVYKSNMVEYVWDATEVPGLRLPSQTPIWYNPYPWVQLSEYQSWADVNKWALKLFATSNTFAPELAGKIDEWKQLPGPEERVLAALQFVQEQIRDAALESDVPAYESATPSAVFARHAGDCKEKTWLLVAALRAMNIEAYPVFVNRRARRTIADLHPSPIVFDHAIVQTTVNNRYYYLDPTVTYERGSLAVRSWPNYGYGLLIRLGVTALTEIPACPVLPKTTVSEYINVGGYKQETGMKIVTVAEGTDARALREHFAMTSPVQIEEDYLAAQGDNYPDIYATAPLKFSDDEQNNRVQITESYSIPKFWKRRREDYNYNCHFYCFNVDDAMHKPEDSARTMPLGIDYPVHQLFHVEANWMMGWPVRPDTESIQNPAFEFNRTMNIVGTTLVVDYEYRALSDVVMPEGYSTYLRQFEAATHFLGCSIAPY